MSFESMIEDILWLPEIISFRKFNFPYFFPLFLLSLNLSVSYTKISIYKSYYFVYWQIIYWIFGFFFSRWFWFVNSQNTHHTEWNCWHLPERSDNTPWRLDSLGKSYDDQTWLIIRFCYLVPLSLLSNASVTVHWLPLFNGGGDIRGLELMILINFGFRFDLKTADCSRWCRYLRLNFRVENFSVF